MCEFHGGIDHAYTFGYLNNALKRDEVNKALLGFWSFLAFGMTRDTYSPVEVTMIDTGENQYTLPHLYSCTEQLRLLRNLLLREDGDVLWIGQGIPREWLENGKHVAVNSATTTFGDVTYRIDVADRNVMPYEARSADAQCAESRYAFASAIRRSERSHASTWMACPTRRGRRND